MSVARQQADLRQHRHRPIKRGTRVNFKPDTRIFETTEFSFETLSQRFANSRF